MTTTTMKTKTRSALLCAALALATGCSSLRVDADHDLAADFTGYTTYGWAAIAPAEDGGPPRDDLQLRRVRTALEAELARRGLGPAATSPDLLVRYRYDHGDRWSPGPPASVTVGYGTWPGPVVGYGYPYYGYRYGGVWGPVYDEGPIVRPVWRITVEMIDAKTDRVVWQGRAEDVVDRGDTPQERAERIRAAVATLLERYPPRR